MKGKCFKGKLEAKLEFSRGVGGGLNQKTCHGGRMNTMYFLKKHNV